MEALQISLFGRCAVRRDGQLLTELQGSKVQELLCYLLLHRDRPSSREMLASQFWDFVTTAQARAYLRRTLWQLQTILKRHLATPGPAPILVDAEWVQWNPKLAVRIDVVDFEAAFERVEGRPARQLAPEEAGALEAALGLYTGDLLEDFAQDWCLYPRERFRHLYFVMLDKMAAYCEAERRYEAAIAFAERILFHDRARECTHRHLMHLRYLAGDRTGALHQYERCARALREELDVDPAEATHTLFEQIRRDHVDAPPQVLPVAPLPATFSLDELKQTLNVLAETEERLRRQVAALEQQLVGSAKNEGRSAKLEAQALRPSNFVLRT